MMTDPTLSAPLFRILIVDGHDDFRDSVHDALAGAFPFIDISAAGDGKQALDLIGAAVPDVILMEIRLPDGNGLRLSERIKAVWPSIAIVIMAGEDLEEYRTAIHASGAKHFVPKTSLSMHDLSALIEAAFAAKYPHVRAPLTLRKLDAEDTAASNDKSGFQPQAPASQSRERKPRRPKPRT
ncbi:MAG: response regulator [Planctomycetota bacterium]|jgi:DNA-binding NarL/FixJ family response regulator